MGRTSKRSPEREQAILNALRIGNTRRAAAAAGEVDQNTFYRWLEDGTFRDAVEKAEAEAERRFLGNVAKAAAGNNWQAAAWWLERRKHEDYARRDKVDMSIDLRKAAEELAQADGLDPAALIAEAERIVGNR